MANTINYSQRVDEFPVTNDGKNGLPVRLFDSSGSAISNASGNPVRLVDQNGNPLTTDKGVPVRQQDGNGVQLNTVTRTVIHASAAETATGNTAAIPVSQYRQLIILTNITAVSGTGPTLQLEFDFSDDGGTTWYSPATTAAFSATAKTIIAIGASVAAGSSTALLTNGLFWGFPFGDTIRLRWIIAGTTPSFTFVSTLIGQ